MIWYFPVVLYLYVPLICNVDYAILWIPLMRVFLAYNFYIFTFNHKFTSTISWFVFRILNTGFEAFWYVVDVLLTENTRNKTKI